MKPFSFLYPAAIVIAILIASCYTFFHVGLSTSEDVVHRDGTDGSLRTRIPRMNQESFPAKYADGSWDLVVKLADVFDLPISLPLLSRDDGDNSNFQSKGDRGDHLNLFHILLPRNDSNSSNNSNSPTPLETYRAISNVVFGIQVAGSLTAQSQRDYLCNDFQMNNIEGLGLNYDKLKQVICTDIPASQIPLSNQTVANSLQLYNAMVWLQMTFNVFFGNETRLCEMFNLEQAAKVGMDANQIMWYMCELARKSRMQS